MQTFRLAARSAFSQASWEDPTPQPWVVLPPPSCAHSLFSAIRCHLKALSGPRMSQE